MRKIIDLLPFLLLLLVLDRFLFLPSRMDATWEYYKGTFAGNSIAFDNIEIINNFEIKIVKSGKWNTFYLLGCYFGNLYLLDEETFTYTTYGELKATDIWF